MELVKVNQKESIGSNSKSEELLEKTPINKSLSNREEISLKVFPNKKSPFIEANTKPISLSTITISIHDPDGTDAVVDNNSSVIFRISKNKNTSRFKILDQIST